MSSTLKRKPIKVKAKTAQRKADDLFSLRIRNRDGNRCRKCGSSEKLTCAHVWSRRYHAIRWVDSNAVCLCWPCHFYFGSRLAEWMQWCLDEGINWDGLHWMALHSPPEKPADALARLTKSKGAISD